ncbi:hypothetical protein OIU84_023172 [Salix udensis]|uniref:Uncharacterized protein n=1 Tax=Salix udensis TaxID=889485 RepID=A0AAD6KQH5_9ROSI|nr:hypothetical protein OIU84_023172 [Salix udensis]
MVFSQHSMWQVMGLNLSVVGFFQEASSSLAWTCSVSDFFHSHAFHHKHPDHWLHPIHCQH